MIQIVRQYIEDHQLCREAGKVIVGVSGGADSVVLLDILFRLGYECVVCHCNFHLRGEESGRDELFVQNLATTYSLPYHKIDFDTTKFAESNAISIEMSARDLRYEWFDKMRRQLNADVIAVAHHRDDSVETVLLNLMRGTGIRGLVGIRPKNGYIIRPLLHLSKEDILNYVNEHGLFFVTDSTNEESIYTRNFIRREIIPVFEQLNPGFSGSVSRTADNLFGAEAFYSEIIDQYKQKAIQRLTGQIKISISEIFASPSPKTLLFEILSSYGFNSSAVSDIYESLYGVSGKEFLTDSHRLIKDRNFLILTENKTVSGDDFYWIPKGTLLTEKPIRMEMSVVENNETFSFSKDNTIAYFNADKIQFPLVMRHWKPGDSFIPFGMTGRKKISDYFSDHKFSLIDKENTWLLCSNEDIIWIVGERTDNRFRVTDQTKNILIVKIKN